jgi:hypothetical protein
VVAAFRARQNAYSFHRLIQKETKIDELINLVTQKAGISKEQAQAAVQTVIKFLKDKLPAPIAGQIDGVLGGGSIKDVAGKVGGLFGKK